MALLPHLPQDPDGAEPPAGITRELARARAEVVSGVEYGLSFDLVAEGEAVEGRAEVRFVLREAPEEDLVLDFAGLGLREAALNGEAATPEELRWGRGRLHLPRRWLRQGENTFSATLRAPMAPAGAPLNVFRDPDGGVFLYTLLVPADAHRLFPCFDQPDLKATFHLALTMPAGWRAVANADPEGDPAPVGEDKDRVRVRFAPTPLLSTYLFAFAAGPFAVVEGEAPAPASLRRPVRLYLRPSRVADLRAEQVLGLHADSLVLQEQLFATPYPFGKLDAVLVPGFPYGGMEHAGAIFYRESALVFDREPTEVERLRRATLVHHEVAHQWFGNLVTMEWFDDLWLKEGFATFVGWSVLDVLEPERRAWLRFHQTVKAAALRVDVTEGTTPVWQDLESLEDAKSVYGPIVYNKAPSLLRELEARMGREAFWGGVRAFLATHAWGSARWQDLAAALAEAGMEDMDRWSDRWLLAQGLPRVRAQWRLAYDGRIASFRLRQESALGRGGLWPLRVEVLAVFPDGTRRTVAVDLAEEEAEVAEFAGAAPPSWVLLNPTDAAYAQFLPDATSREAWLEELPELEDPLLRAVAWSALGEAVRELELDPLRYGELALRLLETERDPLTHPRLLAALSTTLRRHLDPDRARPLRERAVPMLLGQLGKGELAGLEIETFRALARLDGGRRVLDLCRRVAAGEEAALGTRVGEEDRFLAAAALLAAGEEDAEAILRELQAEASADGPRHAYKAAAATPEPEAKERVFRSFLDPTEPPEQWVMESLSFFHWPGQEARTLPFLPRALERLEWTKAHRKIFFLPAWIDAFLGAHASSEALAAVEGFLRDRPDLPHDVRLKVLQSLDGLSRAVRIRARWRDRSR